MEESLAASSHSMIHSATQSVQRGTLALHLVQMKVPVQDEVLGREVVKRVPVDLRSKT